MYPKPIFWHSGQYLEPQHFQDTDWQHRQELAEVLALCRPYQEGVVHVKVNPAALVEGMLVFDEAELIFPDGSHVLWTGRREEGNASPMQRAVPPWDGNELIVYGCLDRFRERYNVAGLDKDGAAGPEHSERYDARPDGQETPDRYEQRHTTSAGNECIVTRLYYNVRLLWKSELGDGNGGGIIPLLRLLKDGKAVTVDPSYIPSLAVVRGSEWLHDRLYRFMQSLADFPRRMEDTAESGTPSLAELLTRQSAARLLAELDSRLQWEKVSPWEIFRVIRGACAEMIAAARLDAGGTALPRYDHAHLTDCFPELIEACEKLLARFLPEVAVVVEAEYSQGILLFRLPEAAQSAGVAFRLAVKSDEPMRTVLSEGRLIAGSPDAVKDAVKLALPVLPLAMVPPPRGLSIQDGLSYLSPDVRHNAWNDVRAAGCLALAYYPGRDPGASRLASMVRLYVLKGSGL